MMARGWELGGEGVVGQVLRQLGWAGSGTIRILDTRTHLGRLMSIPLCYASLCDPVLYCLAQARSRAAYHHG